MSGAPERPDGEAGVSERFPSSLGLAEQFQLNIGYLRATDFQSEICNLE